MEVFVVLSTVLALTLALAGAAPGVNSVDNPSTFRRMIANCWASNDTVTCLSIKGITALNRAARIAKIEILPGVSIQRGSTISARSAKAISENEIIDSLPAEESERSGHLFDLAMDSLANFIDSHSLEVEFSEAFARAIDEGRKLKKKMMPAIALALALKALILSKIALLSHLCKSKHNSGLIGMVAGVVCQFMG